MEYELFDFVTGTLEKEEAAVATGGECGGLFPGNGAPAQKVRDTAPHRFGGAAGAKRRLPATKDDIFDQEKRLQLPGAKLHTKVEIQKDQLCLTVTTDRFARLVHLESSRTSLPFSDNYFDLLPGQSHTVTLAADPRLHPARTGGEVFV